jgi:hypothetical protein
MEHIIEHIKHCHNVTSNCNNATGLAMTVVGGEGCGAATSVGRAYGGRGTK